MLRSMAAPAGVKPRRYALLSVVDDCTFSCVCDSIFGSRARTAKAMADRMERRFRMLIMVPSRTFNLVCQTDLPLRGREHFFHRRCNRARCNVAFFCRNDKWRGQQNVVAICPVHTALRRIGEHTFVHGSLKDSVGNVFFARK